MSSGRGSGGGGGGGRGGGGVGVGKKGAKNWKSRHHRPPLISPSQQHLLNLASSSLSTTPSPGAAAVLLQESFHLAGQMALEKRGKLGQFELPLILGIRKAF